MVFNDNAKKPPKTTTIKPPLIKYRPDFSSTISTTSSTVLPPSVPSAPAGGIINFERRNSNFMFSIKKYRTTFLGQDLYVYIKFQLTFHTGNSAYNRTKQTQPFLVHFETNCHPHLNILHQTTFPQGLWCCCYYPDRHNRPTNDAYSDLTHTDTEMPVRQCFFSEVLHVHTHTCTRNYVSHLSNPCLAVF